VPLMWNLWTSFSLLLRRRCDRLRHPDRATWTVGPWPYRIEHGASMLLADSRERHRFVALPSCGRLGSMSDLPTRSQALVDATPITTVRTGVRTVVELTAYPDGHANIAVGSVDTSQRGAMSYERADSLPLNHRPELEQFLRAILDRLFAEASSTT
jgi:hypothetical protein